MPEQCQPELEPKPKQRKSIGADAAVADFEVTEAMAGWATRQGLHADAVMPETEKMFDHHRAKGSKMADWQAAWRNWIKNAVKFAKA